MTTDEISITTVDAAKALRACKDNMHCSVCPLIFQSPQCSNLEALAADLLEQLQKQLEYARAERDVVTKRMIELEQRPEVGWIPVTERLPKGENGTDLCDLVVVHTKDGEVTTGWINGAYWWVICGESSRHTMRDRSYVTHWMPLPEPPKEGE